jgi:hypothetical protein
MPLVNNVVFLREEGKEAKEEAARLAQDSVLYTLESLRFGTYNRNPERYAEVGQGMDGPGDGTWRISNQELKSK